MANIPRTVMGTSDPVDICKGFNLFAGGNARALQLGFHRSQILLSTNPQILAWRFNVEAGYNFFAGVCGPAYALRFEAQGQTTGDQVRLNITNDETAAGFVFGVTLEVFCNFSVEQFALRWIADGWNSRFAEEWNQVFSARPSVSIDLIEILRDIILKYFSNKNQTNTKLEKSNLTKLKENVSGWGMLDFRRGQFATSGGTLEVNPTYAIPINLIPLTKALPPPFNVLYLADELLQKLWGGLELGPRFTVGIPVKIQMTTIVVENAIYQNLKFDGSQVTGSGGREIANPTFMSMSLSERPGFEITFDFFVNISVCKLFSLEASVPIANITALLGIKVELGPFSHTIASTIGGGPRAFSSPEFDDLAAADSIDVIFERLDEAV